MKPTEPTPALSHCVTCQKPSWNKQVIKWSLARFKAYYCIDCNPHINAQKPHQSDEVSAPNGGVSNANSVEPVYQRPQEEVQDEIDFLQENSITDIPF